MAKTYKFERGEMKQKLRDFGMNDTHIEEVSHLFDKSNKHFDVINFTILLERYGISRINIVSFLKDIGIDDSTIINIFTKADFVKLGMENREITQVVLSDEISP
jgi:hypothetical protein